MRNEDLTRMPRDDKAWYRKIWTLSIQDQSWVEETRKQVDFLCAVLGISGGERILDLACGFGRHSLELGKRGCAVVGVDITEDYIDEARRQAKAAGVGNEYCCRDIREVGYEGEFDIVLNLADGAIGYLESDEENEKIFEVASRALRKGGKHLVDIGNGGFAKRHFPCRNWQYGETSLALADFTWDDRRKTMYFGGKEIRYGEPVERIRELVCDPIRLYSYQELEAIYERMGMEIRGYYGDFDEAERGSDDIFQVQVWAMKR